MCAAALALGATVIEKNITLDRNQPWPEHVMSLEPHEAGHFVQAIRKIEKSLGSPRFKPAEDLARSRLAARRSIYTCCLIKQGDTIIEEHLDYRRPGTGLSPVFYSEIAGRRAVRDILPGEQIQRHMVE
jgi:sialic acid synthase SpsE